MFDHNKIPVIHCTSIDVQNYTLLCKTATTEWNVIIKTVVF